MGELQIHCHHHVYQNFLPNIWCSLQYTPNAHPGNPSPQGEGQRIICLRLCLFPKRKILRVSFFISVRQGLGCWQSYPPSLRPLSFPYSIGFIETSTHQNKQNRLLHRQTPLSKISFDDFNLLDNMTCCGRFNA